MRILILCTLLQFGFPSSSQVIDKVITIEPYLSFQNYEHYKRLVLNSPNSPIEYLDGFNFEWGYSYQLSVKETAIVPWLSDGTQFEYALNNVITKKKVADSTRFKLFIDPNRYYYQLDSNKQHLDVTLKQLNDSTYLYFDKVEIEVPLRLRANFQQLIKSNSGKRGTFSFINEKRLLLLALN